MKKNDFKTYSKRGAYKQIIKREKGTQAVEAVTLCYLKAEELLQQL